MKVSMNDRRRSPLSARMLLIISAAVFAAGAWLMVWDFPEGSFAAENPAVTIRIPAKCIVTDREGRELTGEHPMQNSYVMTADDGHAPMPEGADQGRLLFEPAVSGETNLGEIIFYKPGVYTYTIRNASAAPEEEQVLYHLRAIAMNDGRGSLIVTEDGEEGKTELIFREIAGGNGSPATGDDTDVLQLIALMIGASAGTVITAVYARRRKRC